MEHLSCNPGKATIGFGHYCEEAVALDWADSEDRRRVVALAHREGRQTMNLRTMPGAELAVLRRSNGEFAGWAGADVKSNPRRPELFSEFVFPQFRGLGLGSLLEHFWWTYLDSHGCITGYMRMEFDSNQELFRRRLGSGYFRQLSAKELGPRFVGACRNCELFGKACRRQAYLAVDVRQALAASIRSRGPFRIESLPLQISLDPAYRGSWLRNSRDTRRRGRVNIRSRTHDDACRPAASARA